jgi:hypothetical protein
MFLSLKGYIQKTISILSGIAGIKPVTPRVLIQVVTIKPQFLSDQLLMHEHYFTYGPSDKFVMVSENCIYYGVI